MFRLIAEIQPDIITLGFNQHFDEEGLRRKLEDRGLCADVIRYPGTPPRSPVHQRSLSIYSIPGNPPAPPAGGSDPGVRGGILRSPGLFRTPVLLHGGCLRHPRRKISLFFGIPGQPIALALGPRIPPEIYPFQWRSEVCPGLRVDREVGSRPPSPGRMLTDAVAGGMEKILYVLVD